MSLASGGISGYKKRVKCGASNGRAADFSANFSDSASRYISSSINSFSRIRVSTQSRRLSAREKCLSGL